MARVLWVTPVVVPIGKYRQALGELVEGTNTITYLRKVGISEQEIIEVASGVKADFIVIDAAPGVDVERLAGLTQATVIRPVREKVAVQPRSNHTGPAMHRFVGYRTVVV